MTFLIIILSFSAVYFIFKLVLFIGLSGKEKSINKGSPCPVSVIIAARNEEKNIAGLIESLKCLPYSRDMLEVIIVDDGSSDRTFEIAENTISGEANFHVHKVKDKKLPAKKGALAFGIPLASYPYIIITDADCRPEKDWLYAFSDKFNEGYDFIFGVTPFYQNNLAVNKTACFENLRNSILTFSAAKLGTPYSASARSFGFKKSSFEKIHGYSNTIETQSGDDDLLLREAVKYKLNIGTILNSGAFVYSDSKQTWKEYFTQRSRHTKASMYYLLRHRMFLGAWHILNLAMLFSPILCMINISFLFPFIFKIAADSAMVMLTQKEFGYKFKLIEAVYLQVMYELILIFNFFNAAHRKDTWE